MQCPLNLTPLKDMNRYLTIVNVAGKIVSVPEPETNDGARLLNVKIRDQHADVDMFGDKLQIPSLEK